jgi:hypothetical protein
MEKEGKGDKADRIMQSKRNGIVKKPFLGQEGPCGPYA